MYIKYACYEIRGFQVVQFLDQQPIYIFGPLTLFSDQRPLYIFGPMISTDFSFVAVKQPEGS